MPRERILFVTGRLAETALREFLPALAGKVGFDYEIAVLGISVAALMHVKWVKRKLTVPDGIDRVILPGWCNGDLHELAAQYGVPFELGPKDLFDLPEYFGQQGRERPTLEDFSVEILAEINHAPLLSESALLQQAESYRQSGADLIDLGCIPGETWTNIGPSVRRLRQEGFRLSVDSFDRQEVEAAVEAGAELVLSCNHTNIDWATELPVEFVVVPDEIRVIDSWAETLRRLTEAGRPFRLDPILEPIGFGFTASLERYYEIRRRYPTASMMMGIGNLTELTEVDSAGVNFLLAAICEELQVGSVLTTEVVNWASSSVREFDQARRLVRHSVKNRVLPKYIGSQLVALRDPKVRTIGDDALRGIAARLTDPNFRIFAERGEIHLMNRDGYWHGPDPYEVFDQMVADVGTLTGEHAFYLGMELCKARTALTLGKQYRQDETLQWGFLTVDEISAITRRKHRPDAGKSEESGQQSTSESPA